VLSIRSGLEQVEAQTGDLNLGLGQCVAGMVGAWRLLKLQDDHLQIDLQEYSIPPVDQVLGILYAMTENQDSVPISRN
jgi:hypothetical protein